MAKRPRRISRLPKAPLVEVVFELRWALQAGPQSQPVLQSDPGLVPFHEGFTRSIKKASFGTFRDLSHPLQTGPYGIARRFYKSADRPFPIMQVGPGIFATNEGPKYEWKSFKEQVRVGLRTVFDTYPKLEFFQMNPSYLELRYIDVFDGSLLGSAALFHFTEQGTSLKIRLPPMLNSKNIFEGEAAGRFGFQRQLKEWKKTTFYLDLASAKHNETKEDVIRMETKVVTRDSGIPALKTPSKFISEVGQWLEVAHSITSPFFKELILPDVMQRFGEA